MAAAEAVRRDVCPGACGLLSMDHEMQTVLCHLRHGRVRSRSPKGTRLELALVGSWDVIRTYVLRSSRKGFSEER